MDESGWIRARSDEQIGQRVKSILDAAGRVFNMVPYERVTMQRIAKEAGFTRSNLYRYFSTREEIFLSLFETDIDAWIEEVKGSFTKKLPLEKFTEKWTEILCRQRRLLALAPLLALSLEKNTSEEVYRKIKTELNERISCAVPYIQKVLPSLTTTQCFEFSLVHQALLAGAWPMAQYSEMQARALKELDLLHIKIDFAVFYQRTILLYLKGLLQESESGRKKA